MLENEQLLSLTAAAALFPARRRGRKPSFGCIWRWCTRGIGGVRLECVRVGNCTCTSREAVGRFIQQLTAADARLHPAPAPMRTPRQRQREIAKADEALRAAGVLKEDRV